MSKIFFKKKNRFFFIIISKSGAEISRLILAQAGAAYEDYRLPFEEWPAMKPSNYI